MLIRSLLPVIAAILIASVDARANPLFEAHGLYREKKYADAISAYTKAAAADPKNAEILMFRGLAKSMKGDWAGCIEDLDAAITIDAKSQKLLSTRAFAYLHTGEFEKAKGDFEAIDTIEKGEGQKAQHSIAQALLRRARSNLMSESGDRQKALDDYNRVLAIVPANDIILFERADAYSELKQYKSALKDLDKVIEIDGSISKFGDTHAKRAEVRRVLKDEKGAKEDEAEAKSRSPR